MSSNASLPFKYQIRRSVRAKKIRIVVTIDKIEVVIPESFSAKNAHVFVNESQIWISETLEKLRAKQQLLSLAPEHYREGAMIPYRGQSWPLILKPTKLKRVKIAFDNQFKAHIPVHLASFEVDSAIRLALIKWLKNSVRDQVEEIVSNHQDKFQLQPNSIRIKAQKSRWGSCGAHDDININWVLVLAAPEILEYVVVHELCQDRKSVV